MLTGKFLATSCAYAASAREPATMSFTVEPDRYSAPPVLTCTMPSLSASANPWTAATRVWLEDTLIAGNAYEPSRARSSISAYTSGVAMGIGTSCARFPGRSAPILPRATGRETSGWEHGCMTDDSPIESWLTDMDGVLVHEERAVPGAAEFLARLVDRGRTFLVLTNNSIFTPRDLRARLLASGLD